MSAEAGGSPEQAGAFADRNGFARRRDLDDPELQRLRARCLEASRRFEAGGSLDWSRQWEYPYVLANLGAAPEPGLPCGGRVLDAGSGWRFFAPLLARDGWAVAACDLDARLGARYEALAEREGLALEFSAEDLEALRYPDANFDAVVCVSVLEHTADPLRVVDEFARVLAPGGRLIVTFDVSLDGDRDIPISSARELIEALGERFPERRAFADMAALAAPERLAGDESLLRTDWFRRHEPALLPWRFVSRATLEALSRGRIPLPRPFFDLAVIGVVFEKARAADANDPTGAPSA